MYPPNKNKQGLLIAAPRSGSGKTTVTLGLLRAIKRRGIAVQPFKCGPDYIDPAFHEAACGRPSYNLDSWAMQKKTALFLLGEAAPDDFIVAESAMGLFDGVATAGAWGSGAGSDIAVLSSLPVVLVLDISGQAQTAAAVARGFVNFRPGVEIAGVILNRAASARHESLARAGFEQAGMRVFGVLPRNDAIALPERHLGLVQAREHHELASSIEALADLCEAHLDIADLLKLSSNRVGPTPERGSSIAPPGQRIALACDAAFSFIYPHLLKAWRTAGAEIFPFAPLADEEPQRSADVVWLPGGYPELYAGTLASNFRFLEAVRSFAAEKPVHGECGGYMVMGDGLIDSEGVRHAMLGLFRLETSFFARRLHLGYRRAQLLCDCVLGRRGGSIAGHEFHYSTVIAEKGEKLFDAFDANGLPLSACGLRNGRATGSFFHMIDQWGAAL